MSYTKYVLIMMLCFASRALSQATTVNVAGTSSTLTITNAVQTAVDPALTVSADGNLTDFTVTITGSYTAGDVLAYTGTLPSGITAAAFDATTRSLVFSGTTTAANWQTLLRTVTIQTVSATCFQEQRQVSFVVGNTYYNNMNGHFYENVPGAVNWATAFANAATKSYFGRAGYLATMTSLSETNFLWKIMASDSWMGASDDFNYINAATGTTTYANQAASEGNWYWVTGPEKGTLFSVGNGSPVTQSDQFAYWNTNEPNDDGSSEHYGQFYLLSEGKWNDLPATSTKPYIVEYGGMSTDNTSSNVVFTRNLYLAAAPSGTITGGNTTVCSGTNTTALTLTGLEAGGTVVKWQYSYDDFLTAGTDIPNASTTLTVSNITQNTYYRAVVNTPSCTGLTTSSTRIYVSKAIAGNIVADNNSICANANVNFILNGYSGTVSKWQVSTSSTFASGITDIANTTTALSYQLTSAGTYYFRAAITSCSTIVYTAAYTISCIAIPPPLTITNSLCAANGLDWVTWSNVTTTTATGTMNGVGVTVTQSNPGLGTTSAMFGHANFPSQYNVPNGTTISNEKSGTFTINFAKPINNPQVAFSSIGSPSITVGITTSVPYSVIWAGAAMTYPTSTTMTGTEGYTIISFPGLHSTITMTYDKDESYANIAFGAENTNCSDPITCQGTPITLTASGGSTYLWSPSTGLNATNTASVIATPTVTTTYSVIDTSNACAVASTVTVTVANQAPILSNSVSGTQYFASNSAITPIVISNSGGAVITGGYSVAPALPTGLILGSNGTISGTPTVTRASTIYTITGTNGCGNSTTALTIATGIAATISNFNNVNKMYHDGSYSIVAPTSNSTGAFSYTSSTPAVATISGTTVTILSAGTSTITANQAANASYNSASITATLTVTSVSVLTVGGGISSTNLNYVNQYGQIGGDFGLSANGAIVNAKTPEPSNAETGLVLNLDASNIASYSGTGTTWKDVSGNNRDGTLPAGVTYTTAGGIKYFNFSASYVAIDLPKNPSMTYFVWAKSSVTCSTPYMVLFHSGTTFANPQIGPSLFFRACYNYWNTQDGPGNPFSSGNYSTHGTNWHNYIVVNDAIANTTKLYYDGVLIGSAVYKHSSNTNLTIGNSSNLYAPWQGGIATFKAYNKALTDSEILNLYNSTKGDFGY
ncbi:LamG-like jellyroll fold domain-containing protein [Flavobacterium sp. W22_SRS_FP1]|uniref:LamG-like jellyroll fold domain-containing protein n=1 Tax=Flavobacterium sp. W22_SRS_FP1 TaxID=3240276 RepID=UPI003F8EFAD2